jgi:hypothetical protein
MSIDKDHLEDPLLLVTLGKRPGVGQATTCLDIIEQKMSE